MRLSNLTNGAEQAMARSREIASSLGQHLVGSEHLLLSLLRDEGAASSVLGAFGVRYGSVMAALSRTDGELASQHAGYLGLSYTPNATHVLEHAKRHAEEIRSILISRTRARPSAPWRSLAPTSPSVPLRGSLTRSSAARTTCAS